MKELVYKILLAKEEQGISYSDLAKRTGFKKETLQRYLTGKNKKIPFYELTIIAQELGVLLNGSAEKRSNHLYMLRKSKGMTLEQVATLVGVSKSTVRRWEFGDIVNIRRNHLFGLASALGISVSELNNVLLGKSDAHIDIETSCENCLHYSVCYLIMRYGVDTSASCRHYLRSSYTGIGGKHDESKIETFVAHDAQ